MVNADLELTFNSRHLNDVMHEIRVNPILREVRTMIRGDGDLTYSVHANFGKELDGPAPTDPDDPNWNLYTKIAEIIKQDEIYEALIYCPIDLCERPRDIPAVTRVIDALKQAMQPKYIN